MTIVSVKDLSEELGISRQAVYKRINQLPPRCQPKKKDGVYKLSAQTIDLIRNFEEVTTNVTTTDNQPVVTLETQVKELKEDKRRLYEQLIQKDKQINKLQLLVDQQQQLTLQSNQQIHQLQLEATKQIEEQPNQTTPAPVQAEKTELNPLPTKKGFFSRLFKK